MLRLVALLAVLLTVASVVHGGTNKVDDEETGEDEVDKPLVAHPGRSTVAQELINEYCKPYRLGLRRGRPRCGKDLSPHCLVNGSVVLGSCRLKRAVCVEGVMEDFDWISCAD